jgi:hypothetical protein
VGVCWAVADDRKRKKARGGIEEGGGDKEKKEKDQIKEEYELIRDLIMVEKFL